MMKKFYSIMMLLLLLVGGKTWAATLDNPTAAQIKDCTDETLIVTGTLSADAIAALQNLDANVKHVLLNQVTDYDASADFKFTSTTVENIVLPKGVSEVKEAWFTGCTNLNAAISYTSYKGVDGKSISAYIKKAGTLMTTVETLSLNSTSSELSSPVDEAILAGNVDTSGSTDLHKDWSGLIQTPTIKHLNIQNTNITEIPNNWFNNVNAKIEQIELPTKIQKIAANAFNNCEGLGGSLYIPNTCTEIGERAFYKCSFEDVEFQSGFTSLAFGDYVFLECKNLKHIVLPEGVKNIGKGLFCQCEALESLRLPNTLEYIGDDAFNQTYALKYLVIPGNVKEIGKGAFYNSGITDVYLMAESPEKLPKIYYDSNNDGTFGRINLDGGPTNIKPDDIKTYLKTLIERHQVEGHPNMTESDLNKKDGETQLQYFRRLSGYLTTVQMEEIYRSKFEENHSSMTFLHYVQSPEMEKFLNTNVFTDDSYKSTYNSKGEWWTWSNEDVIANQEWEDFKSETVLTKTYGYVDANGVTWPSQDYRDYERRRNYGNASNNVNSGEDEYNQQPTRIGWRQFVLIKGTSLTNDDIYSKLFDDTWYTMCFPFDLTDEQLETAFNSDKYNVCEFSGAATYEATKKNSKGEDVKVQNLVLCFTSVVYTWYKDKYGNFYYRTRDSDKARTKHYWKAKRTWTQNSDGVWDWYLTTDDGDIMTDSNKGEELKNEDPYKDIWASIDGYITLAGHPYMVHPYKVEDQYGNQTLCTIPKVVYKNNFNKRTQETYDDIIDAIDKLYNDEVVRRPLYKITYSDEIFADDMDGITKNHGVSDNYGRYEKLDVSTTYGHYSFKGTYLPSEDNSYGAWDKTEKQIEDRAYFLGVNKKINPKYPKFWREVLGSKAGKWTQYSAIIIPDSEAQSWEETYLDLSGSGSSTGAKGVNMMFGDFDEEVTTSEIEEIVAEAERKGEPVERMNIIVSINGQVVRQGTDVNGLPSGIYIVNGKKYLVK